MSWLTFDGPPKHILLLQWSCSTYCSISMSCSIRTYRYCLRELQYLLVLLDSSSITVATTGTTLSLLGQTRDGGPIQYLYSPMSDSPATSRICSAGVRNIQWHKVGNHLKCRYVVKAMRIVTNFNNRSFIGIGSCTVLPVFWNTVNTAVSFL